MTKAQYFMKVRMNITMEDIDRIRYIDMYIQNGHSDVDQDCKDVSVPSFNLSILLVIVYVIAKKKMRVKLFIYKQIISLYTYKRMNCIEVFFKHPVEEKPQ